MKLVQVAFALLAATVILLHPAPTNTASAATSQILISQSCGEGGRVNVFFSWSGNDPTALQQWIDLSLFDNGWQPGTFISTGPFPGSATSSVWNGLNPGAGHFVRANQQLADGRWDPSPTYYFVTPICPVGSAASAGPAAPGPITGTSAEQTYRILASAALTTFITTWNEDWSAFEEAYRSALLQVLRDKVPSLLVNVIRLKSTMTSLEPVPARYAAAHSEILAAADGVANELMRPLPRTIDDFTTWILGLQSSVDDFNRAVANFRAAMGQP